MWVTLAELKQDAQIDPDDDRDDVVLTRQLGAARAFVERQHPQYNYDGNTPTYVPRPGADPRPTRPVPEDLVLGTIRLARRWHSRRKSPEALVSLGELGAARIPSFDPDIERLLKIGRYRRTVIV